ncbi:MAG: carbon-nitrogen hydrolase family protein [Verrucomicrobia bacterium]|nr:carbon-nitrogen hydrolase family protein [Verrucomicrobiota bacterium]
MKKLRIALLQANFRSSFPEKIPAIARVARPRKAMRPEDYEFNHRLLISLARKAAAKGAHLAVGSESYLDGWSYERGSLSKIALAIPGPRTDELCRVAREERLWLCVAFMEKTRKTLHNTAVLISSSGEITGIYRKTHETKDVLERMPYTLGRDLPVFKTPWGKVGILICHDRWYPENARTLRVKGAELVLNPTATAVFNPHHSYHEIHRCVQRSLSYVNGLFWASCNSANHGGHSVVIAPDGNVIGEARPTEQVLIAGIDPEAHGRYDFISNLRPQLYGLGAFHR